MTKFVFITGGVTSSLGKGLTTASLGLLLEARGYRVKLRKLDPYLNIDPGTMSPIQHGEVFVTEDGTETDLDLGHYERFTSVATSKEDAITAGKIYFELLKKERKGDYLGKTVQVIPHVTDLIKSVILNNTEELDFLLCEIGGTVGDIEGQPFLEAIRQIGYELGKSKVAYLHVTLIPYIKTAREFKTKPTQHSVKLLNSAGIQPTLILCRASKAISELNRKKIASFCNIPEEFVIPALDVEHIYEVPIKYHQAGLDLQLLKYFDLQSSPLPNLAKWHNLITTLHTATQEVEVALVGKYTKLRDAYKSVIEALNHAAIANNAKIKINFINSRHLKPDNIELLLSSAEAIIVPGGFGGEGIEGKILAIQYARTHNIPFLGICLGMQLAIIEAAQHLANLPDVCSTEFKTCTNPVIGPLEEWQQKGETHTAKTELGGTMRLGSYNCSLLKGSKIAAIYKTQLITERHRHRYEVNYNYKEVLEKQGLVFSGVCLENPTLLEVIELANHPWFIAVQFHPEFQSKPLNPHPIFISFLEAALKINNSDKKVVFS